MPPDCRLLNPFKIGGANTTGGDGGAVAGPSPCPLLVGIKKDRSRVRSVFAY